MTALRELSKSGVVQNVVLYIADSVRADAVPKKITDLGVSTTAIAPSTFTASSLPSIVLGRYPIDHRIWGFMHQLQKVPDLFDWGGNAGFNAKTIWSHVNESSEKPPLQILCLESETSLTELDTPFTYVVHDKGGHSPYATTSEDVNWGSSRDFYHRHRNKPDQLRDLYQQGVDDSAERFIDIYNYLGEEGLLENTLLIYTSDHGELLGEAKVGGVFGHIHPMTPELLEVPFVATGAGIDNGRMDGVVSGIDIGPTLISARGDQPPRMSEGVDLWTNSPPTNRVVRSDVWVHSSFEFADYKATARWGDGGGVVYHYSDVLRRLILGLGSHLSRKANAPVTRSLSPRKIYNLGSIYAKRTQKFGHSPPDPSDFSFGEEEFIANESEEYMIEPDKENLEKLGYL